MEDIALRRQLVDTGRRMVEQSLVVGASGNLSTRSTKRDRWLITPSSVPYTQLEPEDLVEIDEEGDLVTGERAPSFETPVHLAVYHARSDVGAVVHTHSRFASAMALARRELPAVVDEMVVQLGGAVQVATYAPSGSDELAAAAVDGLGDRGAVLLAAHGVVAVGRDLAQAYKNAELVEHLAHIVYLAQRLGPIGPLPADVLAAEKAMYQVAKQL